MTIESVVKDYEDEIKILVYNKYDKMMVFNQYLFYQQYIRNNSLKPSTYDDVKSLVLDYVKKQ